MLGPLVDEQGELSMQILLICLAVEAALFGAAYLAACAGADRWLTLREWWGRARCGHKQGRILAINFDGETVYECADCGKHVRVPL